MTHFWKTPEYRVWSNIIQRCHNERGTGYKWYGARGIFVCQEWRDSFKAFLRDMGRRPTPEHSIDRKNGALGYSPDNCHWATPEEQRNNRTDLTNLTLDGRTLNVTQWARELGICAQTLRYRIYKGWPVDKALSVPIIPMGLRRRRIHGTPAGDVRVAMQVFGEELVPPTVPIHEESNETVA